jgi:hypothetical protein
MQIGRPVRWDFVDGKSSPAKRGRGLAPSNLAIPLKNE